MNEIWSDIKEVGGGYQASNLGRVRSKTRVIKCGYGKTRTLNGRILKQSIGTHGYLTVGISVDGKSRTHTVHRLIASCFCCRADDSNCVNHIDGNKLNNMAGNLEWITSKENTAHAINNHLMDGLIGSRHYSTKLTDEIVTTIRERRANGESGRAIAAEYGVTAGCICDIYKRRTWTHI